MLKLFWILYLIQVAYSANYFCNLNCGKKHTVCKRYPCKVSKDCAGGSALKMDDQSRQWVLDAHNELRNKLAKGEDTRGGNGAAADMHILNYDKEIEYVAQCWANACSGNHDECRNTKKFSYVGQNMFGAGDSSKIDFSGKEWIDKAVNAWYGEIKDTTAENIDKFHLSGPTIGHFTQLVWAKTTRVGCGRTLKSKNYVLIYCNYGPGGNIRSLPVYQRGQACSKCGKEGCNDKYPGLCGKTVAINSDTWTFSHAGRGGKVLAPSPELQISQNMIVFFVAILTLLHKSRCS